MSVIDQENGEITLQQLSMGKLFLRNGHRGPQRLNYVDIT